MIKRQRFVHESIHAETTTSLRATQRLQQLNFTFARNIMSASEFKVRQVGARNTLDYRIFIEKDGKPVSIFHDIPLYANADKTVLNMIVEIPRWSNAKQEISKEEKLNPIKQDTKKGKLRFGMERV